MLKSLFPQKPELKSPREIGLMREAGKLVAEALRMCRAMAKPGVKTIEIDQAVEDLYASHGRSPLFKGYPGRKVPFPAVTCISLNEQVVHGIPGQRVDPRRRPGQDRHRLQAQRLVRRRGHHDPGRRRSARRRSGCWRWASRCCGWRWWRWAGGNWWSEVASAMQRAAETAGFSVVTQYVGHGIGRIMHENPQVPNFVNREVRKHDFRLEEGLVLAVEPMVNMGRAETDVLRDHWTVVTRDGLPSVHVEHTLAITRDGVYVVTADEETYVKP